MIKHFVGFCILLACSASALAAPDRPLFENPYALDFQKSCGPLCVGFLDRYFGGTRHYNEIAALCPPGALGINLESAESALRKLGYHTRTVRLTAESLRSLRWPCIIHEENGAGLGHFVVCTRWQPEHGTFQIYSPPMSLDEAKFDTVKDRMGTALAIVVSPTPLPPADELVPREWSWQALLGIELTVIGALLLVFGRTFITKPASASARVAVLIPAVMLPLVGCAQSAPIGPQVSDDGRTIELGRVLQGADLEATFHVRNDSGSPFRIERVERSCQCQNVRFDAAREIPPHGEAAVAVTVPTKKVVGLVEQQFVVHTTASDRNHAAIPLTVKANVWTPVRAIPSEVMFGSVSGASATRQLRVETDPPELAEKYSSVSAPEFLKVELLNHDRSGLLFSVQLLPEAPKGVVHASISIKFDNAELPELNVPVLAQKTGPIRVVPAKLFVNSQGGERTLRILVASTNDEEFRLLLVVAPEGAAPAWDESAGAQKRHLVNVSFTTPETVDGKTITIKTDLPEEPTIQIPISVQGPS